MRRGRAGLTLAELAVGLVVAGVVLGATWRLLAAARSAWRDQAVVLEVRRNVRAAVLVLEEELRFLAPAEGDVMAASDTAVTLNALRLTGALCAAPDPATGTIVVSDALTSGLRAVDPARDSAFVFRDGETLRVSDDRWIRAGVTTVRSVTCPNGAAGTALRLSGPGATAPELSGVGAGAPVRVVESVRYRLYVDASGQWWLGVRNFSAGAWSATSPVAGPLRPRDGLELRYRDAAGAPTAAPPAIALVQITVRGRSARPLRSGPRAWARYQDSATAHVAPRNQ